MPKKSKAEKAAAAKERERKRKEREAAKARAAGEEVVPALPAAGAAGDGGGGGGGGGAAAGETASSRHASKFEVLDHCTITGVLSSRPDSRDVQIDHLSLTLYGKELISDTELHVRA